MAKPLDRISASFIPLLLIVSMVWLGLGAEGASWDEQESELVSGDSTGGHSAVMAVDRSSNVHVAWADGDDIMFRSKSNGEWGDVVKVTDQRTIRSIEPSIAVDGDGGVHLVWVERSYEQGTEEILQRSLIDGEWSSIVTLSPDINDVSRLPVIAANEDGTLHVVWLDGQNPNTELLYRSKTGGSWGPLEKVRPNGDGHPSWPSIAAGPGRTVNIVWYDTMEFQGADDDWGDIYHRSKSQGAWSSIELVSAGSDATSIEASVAVDDDGVVHVAWKDSMSFPDSESSVDDIYHRAKTSAGWQDVMLVSSGSDGGSRNPSISVFPDGDAHIVWRESPAASEPQESLIVHSTMSDNGWGPFVDISTETDMPSEPTIANDGLVHAHVLWLDFGDHDELGPGSFIYHKNLWVSDKALVEGVIVDANGDPMPGVEIWLSNPGLAAVTDDEGRYAFTIDEGEYIIEAIKDGETISSLSINTKTNERLTLDPITEGSFHTVESDDDSIISIGLLAVIAVILAGAVFILMRSR